MSTYYMFYLAKKTSQGMTLVAPAKRTDEGTFKFEPAVVRSRSFIDWEDWEEFMDFLPYQEISKDKDSQEHFTADISWTSTPKISSISRYCPFETIVQKSLDKGLHIGYTPLQQLPYVVKQNYLLDSEYDIELLPAEAVAEMDSETRKEYGKVAFLAYNSIGYIAHQIVSAFQEFVNFDEKDYYVICAIS